MRNRTFQQMGNSRRVLLGRNPFQVNGKKSHALIEPTFKEFISKLKNSSSLLRFCKCVWDDKILRDGWNWNRNST